MGRIVSVSNEGLTHEIRYNHDIIHGTHVEGDVFRHYTKLTLPLFLTPEVWQRHRYTVSDITITLNSYPVLFLWQCALLFDIKPSNSVVRLSCASSDSMTFTSKSIVVKKLLKRITQTSKISGLVSVLDIRDITHTPPIPRQSVSSHEWERLVGLLPKLLPNQTVDMLHPLYYADYLEWRYSKFVPVHQEASGICAIRIVPTDVYRSSGRQLGGSMTHKPVDVVINNNNFYGVDEMCIFYIVSNTT